MRDMKLSRAIIILIVTLVVVLGVGSWLFQQGYFQKAPATFPPWYPAVNANGDPAVADFENHTPCPLDASEGCNKMKFGIVFYKDPKTQAPTTYLMSRVFVGVGNIRHVSQGTWTITHGTKLDPQAVVYQLDSNAPQEFRSYWVIGKDILFILDQDMKPRLGDAAYGYALNRVPLGQNRVPSKNVRSFYWPCFFAKHGRRFRLGA